ncbi:unnamed protein product [Symbiodinium pilosum]|uniref:Uncharacterized protein n=1 Tax=Symbiodinium pilosum TaxID=2952 RepID=A0A812RRS9_SYMPI|nr:unnamed protein product [Symbiodinium pilosum]
MNSHCVSLCYFAAPWQAKNLAGHPNPFWFEFAQCEYRLRAARPELLDGQAISEDRDGFHAERPEALERIGAGADAWRVPVNNEESFVDEHPPYELEQRNPGWTPVRHTAGGEMLRRTTNAAPQSAGVVPVTVTGASDTHSALNAGVNQVTSQVHGLQLDTAPVAVDLTRLAARDSASADGKLAIKAAGESDKPRYDDTEYARVEQTAIRNRPQRFNWVEDAECPYGALAKVQATSSSAPADQPTNSSSGSGGTGGADTFDADSIKAVKEVHALLKPMRTVIHKEDGPLEIDTSTACPEVSREAAEGLIERYAALVRHRRAAQARVAAVSRDLEESSNAKLVQIMQQGKCETEAAPST